MQIINFFSIATYDTCGSSMHVQTTFIIACVNQVDLLHTRHDRRINNMILLICVLFRIEEGYA